jgi:hypothetical protein
VIQLAEGFGLETVNRPLRLKIWDEPDPRSIYTIGIDPSGGVGEDVGDAAVMVVVDVRTLRMVAMFRCFDLNPFELGREADRLGRYYGGLIGQAHLVVEANNHGQCTLEVLKTECGYWNFYAARGKAPGQTVGGFPRWVNQIGYWMTPKSRDALIHDARKVWDTVSTADYLKLFGSPIRDYQVQREMESFRAERTKTNRQVFQAAQGQHDDIVMALALAWYGRSTALSAAPLLPPVEEPYRDQDFYERENDYIRRFMADRGVQWAPEDDEPKFVKVQVAWKPPSQ